MKGEPAFEATARPVFQPLEQRLLLDGVDVGQAFGFLDEQLAQFADYGDVYTDDKAGGNLYQDVLYMNTGLGGTLEVDSAWTTDVFAGQTALKISWNGQAGNDTYKWAALAFVWPRDFWSQPYDVGGWDLSAATELSFQVRSEGTDDSVEVGVGLENYDPLEHREWITPGAAWAEHTIDLSTYSLSGLNGVFVVAFNDQHDPGADGVTVYFDNVRFDAPPANNLRLLQSYRGQVGDHEVFLNHAYTYDNALAALAYMAGGSDHDWQQAAEIVQCFDWILDHETIDFGSGQAFLRDAYRSGPIRDPATDQPRVAGPEISTGNNAWVMLALIGYYRHTGEGEYLDDAACIGSWIHANCHDAENGGYVLGLDESGEPRPGLELVKSTEHNIDVYAAFHLLADEYPRLGDPAAEMLWRERADDAGHFVMSMYDPGGGAFYVGTTNDGTTANDAVWALDPQAWSVLALSKRPEYAPEIDWGEPLAWAERELLTTCYSIPGHTVDGVQGFDFGKDLVTPGEPDGVWVEGTGQMIAAYASRGKSAEDEWAHFRTQLLYVQQDHPNGDGGGLVAACEDALTTGFDWSYFAKLHTGATAWAVLAECQLNPFTLTGLIPGDANRDGQVDVRDLCVFANNFGRSPAEWPDGDFNGDGQVDVRDLCIFANNFSFGAGGEGSASADDAAVTPAAALEAGLAGWDAGSAGGDLRSPRPGVSQAAPARSPACPAWPSPLPAALAPAGTYAASAGAGRERRAAETAPAGLEGEPLGVDDTVDLLGGPELVVLPAGM